MKNILLSLLAVGSLVSIEARAETTVREQIMNQAEQLVERTFNLFTSPFLSEKDIECLARNIFYESGGEPLEGKVAVGLVTINRSQDPRFPQSVCGVVHQRTTVTVPKQVTEVRQVKTGLLNQTKEIREVKTVYQPRTVYQFSWVGQRNIKIRSDDPRWIESRMVAEELARGGFQEYYSKYANAMNFHAVYVRPGWKLPKIGRVGNHIFYENPRPL